jgi:hypothetical protein
MNTPHATSAHDYDGQWGWDLIKNQAVRWNERGPGEQVLGPYPSRGAAEQWRERVEERNTVWDDQDEAWRGPDEQAGNPAGQE